MKSQQEQGHWTPDGDIVFDQQLAQWVERHALSPARLQAIRQAVLRQAEPPIAPLSLEWWDAFIHSVHSACQSSFLLTPTSSLSRITTTAAG